MNTLGSISQIFLVLVRSCWIRRPVCLIFPPIRIFGGFFGEEWNKVWESLSYYLFVNGIFAFIVGISFKVIVVIGIEVLRKTTLSDLNTFADKALAIFGIELVSLFGMILIARFREHLKRTSDFYWSLSLFLGWLQRNLRRVVRHLI